MRDVVKEILDGLKPGVDLNLLKRKVCKKYGLKKILTNIDVLSCLTSEEKQLYKRYFVTKPSRTLSVLFLWLS